jgi:ketosteroid isomerase-like protein
MESARKKMTTGGTVSYEFLSRAVTVVGNVGVTQYAVKATRTGKDGRSETSTSRVTHTWMRRGTTWEIIGGMSAPYEFSGHTW